MQKQNPREDVVKTDRHWSAYTGTTIPEDYSSILSRWKSKKVRVEWISKLLMETDLPISATHFFLLILRDVEHISRYFKKRKKELGLCANSGIFTTHDNIFPSALSVIYS